MNIDFHTHVKFTKKTEFSLDYFYDVVREARDEGLHAITLTEHFNTERFEVIYDTLDQTFPYLHEYYDVDGFRIFAGMEIDIREGGHVLFTGHREAVRELRRQLEPFTGKESFVPAEMLLQMSDFYPFLKIGAHPFRESNPLHQLPDSVLSRFDAFDLNGKDLYTYGVERMKQEVCDFAARLCKPVVAGSDAHHPLQLASVMNTFEQECRTVDELRQAIQTGSYAFFVADSLPIKVKAANIVKKMLQEQLQNSLLKASC